MALNIFHFFILLVIPSAIVLEEIAFLRSYTLYEKIFVKNFAKELKLLYNSPFLLELNINLNQVLCILKMFHLIQLFSVLSYHFYEY